MSIAFTMQQEWVTYFYVPFVQFKFHHIRGDDVPQKHYSCVLCTLPKTSSILLQISKTTTLPPMRNSRTLVAVVNKSSILLRISKITALPPTRNSRTLTAVAKMSFALKPIYNSTTMRNTQSKYSFVLLVCMHVTAFLVFPISHFLSFT